MRPVIHARDRFADDQGGDEAEREADRRPHEHDLGIEQQPDRDQERRDEEGVAEEVGHRHQRARVRHQAVESDADEEGTDQRLDPDQLGDDGRRGEADEHEHVPQGPLLTEPGEEPPGDPGNDDEAVDREHDEPDRDLEHQAAAARVAGLRSDDQREHHE
jgi:hypothetical protein